MEASGSGLFNNFIGITTVDPSLYQNQTYQMDWSQVMSTSTPFQAEQGAIQDFGAERLQQVYTGMQQGQIEMQQEQIGMQQRCIGIQPGHIGMQQGYIGMQQGYVLMQQEHFERPGGYIGLQQVYSGMQQMYSGMQQGHTGMQQGHTGMQQGHIGMQQGHIGMQQGHIGMQQGHIGMQQGHIGMQQGHIGTQQEHIGVQQEHIGIQQEHIGVQQEHIGIQQEHIGIQQEHIGMQQEHIGMQQEHIGMQQGYIGMQQVHIETQSTSGTQDGDVRTQEGDFRTHEGDFRAYEGDFRTQKGDYRPQIVDFRPQEGDVRPQESDFRLQEGVFRLQKGDFRLHKGDFRLQESDFRPQEGDFIPQEGDFRQQEGDFRQQEGDFRQQESDFRPQEDNFILQEGDFRPQEGDFRLQKGDFRLQEGDFRPHEGDFRLQEGDFRLQEGNFRSQEGNFRSQEGDFRPQEGDFRPQEDDFILQEGDCVPEEGDFRPQEDDSETQDEETPIRFYDKVSLLMHAFGDDTLPLDQSSWLMHNILESQMALLINYCEDVMKIRGAKQISYEDVLFLMRRNKALLKRLLQYLYLQDCNTYLVSGFAEYRGTTVIPAEGEKVHRCLEFLSTIEKYTGDLTYLFSAKNVYDRVLQKRLKRRYSILNSENVNLQKYFEDTIRISIYLSSPDLFKEWLLRCSGTLFDIDPLAISIIDFLTTETIAGLVEKALYLRSRKWKEKKDLLFPLLDFSCSINQYDYSDDEESEDNFPEDISEIDKYSYIPRKYLKERNCYVNNEKKISENGTFYQDSMLAVLPKIVLLPNASQPNYRPSDFIQRNKNPPLNLLVKTDSEMELIPKNPITSQEITNAFIHYQRPKPMTVLLKSKLPYSEKRKTRLVCLAFPEEEFEEDA